MSAVPDPVLAWLAGHRQAVLITLRADGSPQSSNVMYHLQDGVLRVSVTEDRAKTRNLRRRPRAALHVLGDTFWEYASVLVDAELGPISTTPGDEAGRELLDLYEAITGNPHPDPAEFYAAMVDEHRLVLRLTPVSAVAPGLSG